LLVSTRRDQQPFMKNVLVCMTGTFFDKLNSDTMREGFRLI